MDFSLNIVSFSLYFRSSTNNFKIFWAFRDVEKVFGWIIHKDALKFIANMASDLFISQDCY